MAWENQLTVELIDHMGTDACIADAARVSFDKDIQETSSSTKDEKLIHYLAKHNHSSPFRHVQIKLRCTAPIWMARQLHKHQVGMTVNEISRRYVGSPIDLFEQEFRMRPDNIKQGSKEVSDCRHSLTINGESVSIYSVQRALLNWYDNMIASGFAPETVRGYMPLNMMTSWIWTGSLPAFFHVYSLRVEGTAQKEIQVFAEKIREIVQPLFPIAWNSLELYK